MAKKFVVRNKKTNEQGWQHFDTEKEALAAVKETDNAKDLEVVTVDVVTTDPNDPKRLKKEEKIDYDDAHRVTTFDQNLVQRARIVGVNPKNFQAEEELTEGVERAEQAQAEADQKAEDEQIKPAEPEAESESENA